MSELTEEQIDQLENLSDPDDVVTSDQYKWGEDFQREILGLLSHDRNFLLESRTIIEPKYFISEIHQNIVYILFEHFDKYNALPNKTQIIQELRARVEGKSDEIKAHYMGELNSIIEFFVPGLETRKYYRDKISNFAKTQALKVAFSKCLELIKKDPEDEKTWTQVQDVLKEALTTEHNFEIGLDYFQTVAERYERKKLSKDNGDVFSCGFEYIDNALKNNGLLRGEMGSWVGLSGTGKSLALVHTAIVNMMKGKKVLYLSLEIDQDAVAERFDAGLADPKNEHGITIFNLDLKVDKIIEGLNDFVEEYDDKRLLVVKQFPGGTMDVNAFRAYFSQVCLRGFRPDMVIIDYIGEMKDYPGMPTHESRYRITRDLRGFAVEEKVCLLTAMQPNRGAKEIVRDGGLIDDDQLSDSYAQIKPLDAMWSLNQLPDEKECGQQSKDNFGLARVYVIKHREGKSRFQFNIMFDYNTLQMSQIPQDKADKILKKYRLLKEKSVTDAGMNSHEDKITGGGGKKKSSGKPPLVNFASERDDVEEPEPEPEPKPEPIN